MRQHIKQQANVNATAKGTTLSLFAEDEAIGQWRYAAMVTDLNLAVLQIWRLCHGRADCENRITELKYDFAAGGLNLRDLWATAAALHTAMQKRKWISGLWDQSNSSIYSYISLPNLHTLIFPLGKTRIMLIRPRENVYLDNPRFVPNAVTRAKKGIRGRD